MRVLEAFRLTQFFCTHGNCSTLRVTSGYWTTRNQLAFGISGCKDFRSIFGFYRFQQFQETAIAVDDLVQTWNNSPMLWKRVKEKPCVLQIAGFGCGPTGTSVANNTISRFEQLLCRMHDEFFANECLRKSSQTIAGITQNAELYIPRGAGFMNNLRDTVERKMIGSIQAAPPSPSHRQSKYEIMAGELIDMHSSGLLKKELASSSHKYDNETLGKMLYHLGLNATVNSREPNEIRNMYIDRFIFYCQKPRESRIKVYFGATFADIDMYEGMPMHDFIRAALDKLHSCIKAKLEPLVLGQEHNTKRNFNMLVADPVRHCVQWFST